MKSRQAAEADHLCDTMSHKAEATLESSRLDPRSIRSARALEAAMLTLLELKPLEQITIQDIAAEAGVHRATFFRHHATKEDLLQAVAAEQIRTLVDHTLPLLEGSEMRASVLALCNYVNEHRVLWTALLTGGAAAAMREELLRISREVASDLAPAEAWWPVELGVNCSVSLIYETLSWWLGQSERPAEPAEVARILGRLLNSIA